MGEERPAAAEPPTGDWIRTFGTVLVGVGLSMWIVYAVGKYVLGWAITDRQFLPYHLATILPGMVLRYHRLLFDDVPRRLSGRARGRASDAAATGAVLEAAWSALLGVVQDAFTGIWVGAIVVVAILDRKARAAGAELAAPALREIAATFFWLAVASVLVVAAAAALRLRAAGGGHGGRRGGDATRQVLRVKHVLLAFAFVGGSYFAYACAFEPWRLG
jgi:hypothetical protein